MCLSVCLSVYSPEPMFSYNMRLHMISLKPFSTNSTFKQLLPCLLLENPSILLGQVFHYVHLWSPTYVFFSHATPYDVFSKPFLCKPHIQTASPRFITGKSIIINGSIFHMCVCSLEPMFSSHMRLQMMFSPKSFSAKYAMKWFLSRVCQTVPFYVSCAAEISSAKFTYIHLHPPFRQV